MTKYEKRKLKSGIKNIIYRHSNGVMYAIIFLLATIITVSAAVNRSGKISYVDESRMALTETESFAIKNSKTNKVASVETNKEKVSETLKQDIQQSTQQTTQQSTQPTAQQETTSLANAQKSDDLSGKTVQITTDTLYIRKTPKEKGEVVGMAEMDETYSVITQTGDWIKINYDGNVGYVNSQFVKVK